MKDATGRELQVGDQVVYAQSLQYSARIVRGLVTGFTPKKVRFQPLEVQQYGSRAGEPVGVKTINPGRTLLVTNDEPWPETEEFLNNGWVPVVV